MSRKPSKIKRVRVYSSISEETNDVLDMWAEKLAVTKSVLLSMSIQAGIRQIIRVVAPEESLPPETWAKIFKEQGKLISLENEEMEELKNE